MTEALMTDLEHNIQAAKQDDVVKPVTIARQNAYQKLTKYYNLSDEAHTLYAAATLLSPERRGRYFNKHWNTPALRPYLPRMRTAVKRHWEENYNEIDEDDDDDE